VRVARTSHPRFTDETTRLPLSAAADPSSVVLRQKQLRMGAVLPASEGRGPGPARPVLGWPSVRQLSGQYGRISMTSSSSSSGPPAAAAIDTDIRPVLFIAALWILIRRAPCRSCWRQVWHGHLQRRCSFKAAQRWHLASTVTSSYDVTTSTSSITVEWRRLSTCSKPWRRVGNSVDLHTVNVCMA